MTQLSFSDSEFTHKKRQTRKEKFLSRMEKLMPWKRFEAIIEPYYPKAGNGRRPYPLKVMLRIHCMQNWYNLSDEAMEDALYEIASMRQFAGLTLNQAIPDSCTMMNFRHLLEKHQLSRKIFDEVNQWLADANVFLKEGTLVDATIIDAPSSTKNKTGTRDPEMHQTKKGNQYYFGMKAHIGVDARLGTVHSFSTTPANEHDITQIQHLLHGDESMVFADAGYIGAEKREELKEKKVDWFISQRPSKTRALKKHPRKNKVALNIAFGISSLRAKVEHPFRVIKRQFGFSKTRYRGLAKNDNKLAMLFSLANIYKIDQIIRRNVG